MESIPSPASTGGASPSLIAGIRDLAAHDRLLCFSAGSALPGLERFPGPIFWGGLCPLHPLPVPEAKPRAAVPRVTPNPRWQRGLQQSLWISSGWLPPLSRPSGLSGSIKGKSRCQSSSKAPARRMRVHVPTSKCILTISSVSELRAELGMLSSTRGSFHLTGVTPVILMLPAQSWHTQQPLQSFVHLQGS